MAFSQQGPRTVCILSANGAICNVTLRQPAMSGGTVTYEVCGNVWLIFLIMHEQFVLKMPLSDEERSKYVLDREGDVSYFLV